MTLTKRQRVTVVLAGCLLMWGAAEAFSRHYGIGFDTHDPRCLPWRVYLIDRTDRTPERFALMAFRTQDVPHYRDGTQFMKYVAGMPGDVFRVMPQATTVAGVNWGPINPAYAKVLGTSGKALAREVRIPEGKVAMLTGSPVSYDSRYFGFVDTSRLVGRAVPLW